MKHRWHTAWSGTDVVIYRDDAEADRIHADDIRRVVFVYRADGSSPGDLQYALVETDADVLLLGSETGFAGRVNFERLAFWAERDCVYWVPQRAAALPLRVRRGSGWLGLGVPTFRRMPLADLEPAIASWPLEGPQTWDERKWKRIERNRPFAAKQQTGRPRN